MTVRQIALAAVATLATAGLASAQAPWSPTPLAPAAYPKASVSPIAQVGGTTVAGCSSCSAGAVSASPGLFSGVHARLAASPLTIGEGCANNPGCGSFASERTFLFGSCRQFFNAGNKCGGGCGSLYGPGGFGDKSPCVYGSYLNR